MQVSLRAVFHVLFGLCSIVGLAPPPRVMDQRMEARVVLQAVYWSCMHGWLYRFLYGECEGFAVAAAEWYVQRQLLPTCQRNVGSVICHRNITAEATAHLCWEETLPHPQDNQTAEAPVVQEAPAMQTQIGGSSSSSGEPTCVADKQRAVVLASIPEAGDENDSVDDVESADHDAAYWEQRAKWESQYEGEPKYLVHFVTITGTVIYSLTLPWHATLEYVEYAVNKALFFLLDSWEYWELAVKGWRRGCVQGRGMKRKSWRPVSRGEPGFGKVELKDVECDRTDDWQMFLTVIRVRRCHTGHPR